MTLDEMLALPRKLLPKEFEQFKDLILAELAAAISKNGSEKMSLVKRATTLVAALTAADKKKQYEARTSAALAEYTSTLDRLQAEKTRVHSLEEGHEPIATTEGAMRILLESFDSQRTKLLHEVDGLEHVVRRQRKVGRCHKQIETYHKGKIQSLFAVGKTPKALANQVGEDVYLFAKNASAGLDLPGGLVRRLEIATDPKKIELKLPATFTSGPIFDAMDGYMKDINNDMKGLCTQVATALKANPKWLGTQLPAKDGRLGNVAALAFKDLTMVPEVAKGCEPNIFCVRNGSFRYGPTHFATVGQMLLAKVVETGGSDNVLTFMLTLDIEVILSEGITLKDVPTHLANSAGFRGRVCNAI